jgi:hypothetical protein
MHQLADTRTARHWAANIREIPEQINMIEERIAKVFRCGREVEIRIIEDFLEVG